MLGECLPGAGLAWGNHVQSQGASMWFQLFGSVCSAPYTGLRAVPSGPDASWKSSFLYSCWCLQPGQVNLTLAVPVGTILEGTVNILMQKGFLQTTAHDSLPCVRPVMVGHERVGSGIKC